MPPGMKAAMTLHKWVWLCANKTLLTKPGGGPDSADGLCPAVVLDHEKTLLSRAKPSLCYSPTMCYSVPTMCQALPSVWGGAAGSADSPAVPHGSDLQTTFCLPSVPLTPAGPSAERLRGDTPPSWPLRQGRQLTD